MGDIDTSGLQNSTAVIFRYECMDSSRLKAPSKVSPLAADEYWPALSVDKTPPPSLLIADSKDKRVLVDGS